jgi:poly-gamma-glutamate biosynthesis protein PgsC/CapC
MQEYNIPTDTVRMVLALGVIVSILVYERWRLTGGAAVVAGYLAIYVDRPLYIVTTVALAVAAYYFVQRIVARRMFLYGRRRLVVMIMVGMILQGLTSLIAFIGTQDAPWLVGLYGVGFVLPGLMAQDMERQGVRATLLAVGVTVVLTFLLFRDLLAIKSYLPIGGSSAAPANTAIPYSYPARWLVPAVFLSVLVSALLFEWTGIRSGGFLAAAYTALFILQPLNLAFIVASGSLVYLFVVHYLMHRTAVFGRTKFAMMVLTGLVFTWALEGLVTWLTRNAFVPFAGFSVISPMIAALIANDGERQGLHRTLAGLAICTLVVFTAIKGLDLVVAG